jgi:polysaccharide export outer membrane protein
MRKPFFGFMLRFLPTAFCSLVLLAGCSSLPSSGPTTDEIIQRSKGVNGGVELVSITPSVNAVLSRRRADSFIKTFGDYRPSLDPQIGIGDTLSITIWEAAAGGLFSSALVTDRFSTGSKSATIPEQVVGRDGSITVPYAGRIQSARQGVDVCDDAAAAIHRHE